LVSTGVWPLALLNLGGGQNLAAISVAPIWPAGRSKMNYCTTNLQWLSRAGQIAAAIQMHLVSRVNGQDGVQPNGPRPSDVVGDWACVEFAAAP